MSIVQFTDRCSAVAVSEASASSNGSHHPRGYRELRSPAEMRKLLNRKVADQCGRCGICHDPFTDCSEIVPDHIEPRGMGGEHDEMIILTTFKPYIDGATDRRDPKELNDHVQRRK